MQTTSLRNSELTTLGPVRYLVVFALGFFALAAQTLLFRDFLTAFEGNELGIGTFFGSWLLWVALGALAGLATGRKTRQMPIHLARHFVFLTLLYVPAFVLEHYLITHARGLAGVAAYELFPFGRMVFLSLLTNAPVSFLTGFLFTLACKWWVDEGHGESAGLPAAKVYIFETFGGFVGGVAVTLLLARGVTAETIFLLSSLVLAVGVAAAGQRGRPPLRFAPAIVVLVALVAGLDGWWAEANSRAAWGRLLPEQAYQGRFTTAQAPYLYGERTGQFIVMSAGGVCETLPNTEHASEVVALNLAQKPQATRVLVAGPDSLSVCLKFMELPQIQQVTWLHPDPDYPVALAAHLPEPFRAAATKLVIPGTDLRQFLEQSTQRYDIAVLNLPDAATLVLNRYSTQEFFALLKGALADDGIVSLRVSGGANYLGGELAYLGASALKTLESVFEQVVLKPGDESWFIASDTAALSESPALLRDRFGEIEGAAELYPPEGLLSLYLPDRIAFQMLKYQELTDAVEPDILVNTDGRPKALLYSLLTLLRRTGMRGISERLPLVFNAGFWICACAILLYALLRLVYLLKSPPDPAQSGLFDSHFLVASTGLAGISLSIVLMFLYQSRFGSLFLHIGLVNALFMLGSFAGGLFGERLLARRPQDLPYLLPAALGGHFLFILSLLLLPADAPRAYFGLLFALCGVFTGIYFPIAAQRMMGAGKPAEAAGSRLETLDHLGGAVGAMMTGLFMLPVLGTSTTLYILVLLVAANAVPMLAPRRRHRAPDPFDYAMRPAGYTMFGLGAFFLIASQIVTHLEAGQEGRRLFDAARALTGTVELVENQARLEDGAVITYFTTEDSPDAPGTEVFGTRHLAEGVYGYAGSIVLAVQVDHQAVLRDFRIVHSKETPAYLDLVMPWTKRLLGRNLATAGTFEDVDGVSGATLTSEAIRKTLDTAGKGFATQVLGMDVEASAPSLPTSRLPDRDFMFLAALMAAAVALRFRPGRWRRRILLLAALLAAGPYLNLQYSTQHVFSLLSLSLPETRLSGAFFVAVLIPILVAVFGNVYCGYVCPFGALQELLGDLRPRSILTDPGKGVWRYGRAVKYLLLLLLAVVFALTRDYTVLSADLLITIFGIARDRLAIGAAIGVLVLSVVYRRFWCRNLCPAGAFLALLNSLQLFKRMMPKRQPSSRPLYCDMGVRTTQELDCLRCDRCIHEEG